MTIDRKVILYIATSLDGYIAGPGDDLSFLSIVEQKNEDYGYGKFIATVDTVILGRKTYDWIMKHVPEFVHADKQTFVITRAEKTSIGNTHFYTQDLKQLILELKNKEGKNIFIDGGAEIVNDLLKKDLIDECVISIIPFFIGDGVKLFNDGRPGQKLELISVKDFLKGLVQLHYKCIHN